MDKAKAKTKNDGKSLDRLVKLIESQLIPEGFQVETRKRIYNDAGVQIAELDIVITGKLGSASIKWLIECRDRPSEGPAPASWIEQLIGRRGRFNFDKVMAVSTTGFAEGAIEEAGRAGIELRALDDLTYETVADWLPFNAPVVVSISRFNAVNVYAESVTDQDGELAGKVSINQASFVEAETGEAVTLQQIWQDILKKNPRLSEGVEPNGESKELNVRADYTQSKRYQFLTDRGLVPINYIDFQVTLTAIIPQMPLSQVSTYSSRHSDPEEEEQIVHLARWEGTDEDIVKELIFIGVPKKTLN